MSTKAEQREPFSRVLLETYLGARLARECRLCLTRAGWHVERVEAWNEWATSWEAAQVFKLLPRDLLTKYKVGVLRYARLTPDFLAALEAVKDVGWKQLGEFVTLNARDWTRAGKEKERAHA